MLLPRGYDQRVVTDAVTAAEAAASGLATFAASTLKCSDEIREIVRRHSTRRQRFVWGLEWRLEQLRYTLGFR